MSVLSTSAQEIYDEVRRIEKEAKAFANDTKNDLEARKIATFKYDAIYYLIDKASQEPLFSEYELGVQTNAMIEFVNLFVSKLSTLKKNKDKEMLKAVFRTATINNSLFNDVDKEVIYSYVDNENFIHSSLLIPTGQKHWQRYKANKLCTFFIVLLQDFRQRS